MKHNIESSLKRFLKRKVKITMGFVVAFLITGTVGFGETLTGKDPFILNSGEKNIEQDDLEFNFVNNAYRRGILIEPEKNATMAKATIKTINDLNINVNHYDATGICVRNGGELDINSKNLSITAITEAVETGFSYSIAMGIDVDNHPYSPGLKEGGKLNITADSVNIIAKATHDDGWAYGINCITRTEDLSQDKVSQVVINAKNTNIIAESSAKGQSNGIIAWSQGQVFLNNGNVSITADNAINTRGKAVTEINKNNNSDYIVNLKGDIVFQYASNSGTPVDADVTINLANSQSKFTGRVFSEKTSGTPGEGDLDYDGMVLGLSNGGEWENTGESFVNDLKLNGGVVTNKGTDYGIKIDKLLGNGGEINLGAKIEEDGTATSGKLAITTVDNNDAKFNVNYSGEGNLEVSQEEAKKVFEDLAENITVGEGNSFNANAKIEEGLISREYEAEFVKGSGDDVVVKPETVKVGNLNSMVEGMRDLATINVLSWRQEMSSLNERMGELRNSTGSNGVWARVYGGKVENGSKYDNEYQTYQVGYDKKYPVENGDLFVGALVSYTDGKTDYNLGDGENYSVGAGVYATWVNRDGQFADVVLKQSRLHNKFDVRSKNGNLSQHGDYSNWGTSLSGQYGRRFDLDDKFFVEPSVQLTFGRVSSEDYTTSAGVKVEQDTAYTLVGDVGTAVGYKFSDRGNVYARALLVKEFKGDIDTKYSYGGATEYTSEDLSDTWGEFGVGVNYRIKENVNMYVDIQRTEEATVENKWQANLGFRWEF